MATILYGRVSTVEQTSEHQLSQAKAAGFKIEMPCLTMGPAASAHG
jgi:DNA invertase Pin-like site-specific DNA recombinase